MNKEHPILSSMLSTNELIEQIKKLKQEMNAIILAHYYTVPEIQQVADVVGDSLALARAAEQNSADVIVFAGVYFMGETAKMLNPNKLALMPDLHAGCPLADSCQPEEFIKLRSEHPDAIAITYINSTAEIKALTDITCTSSNAEKIVRQIPANQPIIFGPDRNLGAYISRKLNRKMILWQGYCYVHEAYSAAVLEQFLAAHAGAQLIAHPECREEVLLLADFVGSTQELLNYTTNSQATTFVVATEPGILYEMQQRSPHKTFLPAPRSNETAQSVCTQMKQNTLLKLHDCMVNRSPEILVNPELQQAALKSIRRMLEMS